MLPLESIYNDIRRRVFKWVKNSDIVPVLKEQDDYTITVKLNEVNQPAVSIYCALCQKVYKLNETPGKRFMLSNWTKHFDRCKKLRPDDQCSLSEFIVKSQSKSSLTSRPIKSKKSSSLPNSSGCKSVGRNVADNECEYHQEISDSKVSSAKDCSSKLLTIREECENGFKISSDACLDEKVDCQENSLVHEPTSIAKEGEEAAVILLKDRKQDFQEDSLAWVKQESH